MKVRFVETEYHVNKSKGVVVCSMKVVFDTRSGQKLIDVNKTNKYFKLTEYKVTGVAKKHKDDEWNETIGRRIAESKAKMKVYRKGIQICEELIRRTKVFEDEITSQMNNLDKFLKTETLHMDKLMSETDK